MSLLAAEDLVIGYGGRVLVRGISLSLAAGSVTCLLGRNGAGKTTLFRTLMGFVPPLDGTIALDGEPLARLSRTTIARRIAYVPQAESGVGGLSVLDLVLAGRTAHLGAFGVPARADRAVAMAALDALGIAALAARDLDRVSGGQRQLALIARALAQQAGVIVMDEPTASLDLGNRARVLGEIRALAARGFAVLLSTHEPEHAFAVADTVALLGAATGFLAGPPAAVLTSERLSALYGVAVRVERTGRGRLVVG